LFYNGHGCVNINEDKKVKLSLCLSTMLWNDVGGGVDV
jgi:hypothetical protein